MDDQSRRDFLKDALKLTAVVTSGIAVSSLDIKINPDEGIRIGRGSRMSVGMSEASATCGAGLNCSGGGGQCGAGLNCAGDGGGSGGGQCGAGLNCSGGGGQCGAGLNCGGS